MDPMKKKWLVAGCVILLSLTGCGVDNEEPSPIEEAVPGEQQTTLETTLRSAATGEETFAAENFTYTNSLTDLQSVGLNIPSEHNVQIVSATESEYCIEASFDETTMYVSSGSVSPKEGTC